MVRLLVRRLVPLVVIIGAVLSIQIIQTAERDIYFLLQPRNAISFVFLPKYSFISSGIPLKVRNREVLAKQIMLLYCGMDLFNDDEVWILCFNDAEEVRV